MALKKFMTFIFAASLLLFNSGCYFFPKEETVLAPPLVSPEEVSYNVAEVTRGDIESSIKCSGSFVSVLQENLFFKYRSGRLKAIYLGYGDFVKKGALVAELETDSLERQIMQQEIMVKKAELTYQKRKTEWELAGGRDDYNLKLAGYDLELAKLQLADLKQELEKARLVSTIDGYVTYITSAMSGDNVSAYQNIVRIADPDNLLLEYTGKDASSFAFGTEVNVKLGDNVFKGKVVMNPTNVPFEERERYRETVRIEVENLPDGTELGDSASITLLLEKSENTLLIPRNTVKIDWGSRYVYVLEHGVRTEKHIKIGIESGNMTEVLEGLEEGEKVIIN